MNTLEKISYEIMKFMRGKYRLDEIGDGKDELKFKQGKKTILTIYTREDRFTFLIIFGKQERDCFELKKNDFSQYIRDYYEKSNTYHDGKWMFIDVTTLDQLEEIKKLIQIKKKPNRKPFSKQNAEYGKCGHRCDLCIHYSQMDEEQRTAITEHLNNMWGVNDWSMRCGGCNSETCYCNDDECDQKKCAKEKGISACMDCKEYPCKIATVGDCRSRVHTNSYAADDITWAILPFVPGQYENL